MFLFIKSFSGWMKCFQFLTHFEHVFSGPSFCIPRIEIDRLGSRVHQEIYRRATTKETTCWNNWGAIVEVLGWLAFVKLFYVNICYQHYSSFIFGSLTGCPKVRTALQQSKALKYPIACFLMISKLEAWNELQPQLLETLGSGKQERNEITYQSRLTFRRQMRQIHGWSSNTRILEVVLAAFDK